MRIALMALAVLHFVAALFVSVVGSFADGATFMQRATAVAVHPIAAAAVIGALSVDNPRSRLAVIAVALVIVNVAADAYIALSILTGASRGEAWLPIGFAVIPALAGAYICARFARAGRGLFG